MAAAIPGDRAVNLQHWALAILCAWLILTSPWIALLRRVPADAGFLDRSHVLLGLVASALALTYAIGCTRAGRSRLYFPWLSGQPGVAFRELRGLARGQIPAAEGGGLFGLIEGLLLLLLLATAATGAAWYLMQGHGEVLAVRGWHILLARWLTAAIVLHVVSVSLHLVDFVRD